MQSLGKPDTELAITVPDALTGDRDPALCQDPLDVAQTEVEYVM